MIKFTIGGKNIDPNNFGDAIMSAVLQGIKAELTEKISAIRDPDTGEFPTIVVRGADLDSLTLHIEGSEKLVALVSERLGLDAVEGEEEMPQPEHPKVFLSYAFEDAGIAKNLAEKLQAKGIEVWWAQWCIAAGDSLRQKIDEGIGGCTHFLVLLTPNSISKPWVNQEIDAGLVRRLRNLCRFLPVRHSLDSSALPPLLSGMLSPEVDNDENVTQLINDIHGISRRPSLGEVPVSVSRKSNLEIKYSPAATAIAKLFVERSINGLSFDPQMDFEKIQSELNLTEDDVNDAFHELSAFFRDDPWRRAFVRESLFTEFDQYWMPWIPAEDALRLATDIVNDSDFPSHLNLIATRYDWPPRRLNPAITYLLERSLIDEDKAIGSHPYTMVRVRKTDALRRFVKSRAQALTNHSQK